MKLVKSLLLGSAAGIAAVSFANAADLPSKKAAPASYVKICDAYGAGFFYIPGTDSCVKLGGRVRIDYDVSPSVAINKAPGATATPLTFSSSKDSAPSWGYEARMETGFDVRTQTAYGTLQSYANVKFANDGGVSSATTSGTTLTAAYIRFAGITAGQAKDNFSFMPSTIYGASHWSSFANGARQLAYTAVLGGGFSATLALQDPIQNASGGTQNSYTTAATATAAASKTSSAYVYNGMPQINGRLDLEQGWGSAALTGAFRTMNADLSTSATTNDSVTKHTKGQYAVGAGLMLKLPMISAGDNLYVTGAYAQGMSEYTVNYLYWKSSAQARDVGGYAIGNAPGWLDTATGIQNVKSWNIAGQYSHFFAPQYRGTVVASYGQLTAPAGAAGAWDGSKYFGDTNVASVGIQFAWLPVKNFEIGIEALYAKADQKIQDTASAITKVSADNLSGRIRLERNF